MNLSDMTITQLMDESIHLDRLVEALQRDNHDGLWDRDIAAREEDMDHIEHELQDRVAADDRQIGFPFLVDQQPRVQ